MLKALGLSKKPPKEELVVKHKDQVNLHNHWKTGSINIKKITNKLSITYQSSKGGFAVNRYEELKNMIKEAIQHLRQLEQDMKNRPRSGTGPEGGAAGDQPARKLGLISQLKRSAQGFASHQDDLYQQKKDYAEMSTKELETEIEHLRKQILQYKQEYYKEKEKIEELGKGYEDSKRYNPTQRYTVLKTLIKTTTR